MEGNATRRADRVSAGQNRQLFQRCGACLQLFRSRLEQLVGDHSQFVRLRDFIRGRWLADALAGTLPGFVNAVFRLARCFIGCLPTLEQRLVIEGRSETHAR
jgi:hypothetical protein